MAIKTGIYALGEFTELTPPDWYSEHMALRGARPMMAPWKEPPLQTQQKQLMKYQ